MKFKYIQMADKFKRASKGHPDAAITVDDLTTLGLKWQQTYKSLNGNRIEIEGNWENLCSFVYERLTGREMPKITAAGVGFRSQAAGEYASLAILEFARIKAGIKVEEVLLPTP